MNGFEYDESRFEGPPRNLPRDKVFKLFGKTFTVLHNDPAAPHNLPRDKVFKLFGKAFYSIAE